MGEYHVNPHAYKTGDEVRIGERTQIGAINGPSDEVHIGDSVFIGPDVRILAPRITIGDYCTIHHHTTIYGYEEVVIGACTWIGQNAVLNCTARLSIGRGCTISAFANVWTHFSGGDMVQGCNFNRRKAAAIGDDAWLGVQATLAPVAVGEKAMILAGAVVTKDIPPNTVWGGNPAVDLTAKLGQPYSEISLEEKFAMMTDLLREYYRSLREAESFARGFNDHEFSHAIQGGRLQLGGITVAMERMSEDGTSIFDVRDRTYSKLRTPEEIGFMHFLLPRVKFYPRAGK